MDFNPESIPHRQASWHQFRARRAFTLVEVMITGLVITMVTLGVLRMLVYAYREGEAIRYRDAARAMLVTFTDEFLRLSNSSPNPAVPGTFVRKAMFVVDDKDAPGPNGMGLTWNPTSKTPTNGTKDGLQVRLGDVNSGQIDAMVTKEVFYLNEDTGVSDGSPATTAAGFMLKGVFTIRYSYNNRDYVETFTVARTIQ